LTEDLERRGYVDPFWHLAIFDDPRRRVRAESTAQWVLAKLESLRQKAARLNGQPSPSATGPARCVALENTDCHQPFGTPVPL
jgi:hypothetical protein